MPHIFSESRQNNEVVETVDSMTRWDEFIEDNAGDVEKVININFLLNSKQYCQKIVFA